MRVLFRDVIPALLGHRLAPLALCNATVVSEFERLASRLRLLDDGVVPRALLASRAGGPPATVCASIITVSWMRFHCMAPQVNLPYAAIYLAGEPRSQAVASRASDGSSLTPQQLARHCFVTPRGCCDAAQRARGSRGRWRCSSPSTRTCFRDRRGF